MPDLDSRQRTRALSELVLDPSWSEAQKKQLAVFLTLSMYLDGRGDQVSPQAAALTAGFLDSHGISATDSPSAVIAKLEAICQEHPIPRELAGGAERIIRADVLRRQTGRIQEACKTIFGGSSSIPENFSREKPAGAHHSLVSIRVSGRKTKNRR